MIMRGTTPRALSWPGCLVMLAVGAFFLPLLPALQAQAPDKEAPDIKAEKQKIEADTKAEVERAKAALKQAQAALDAARARAEKARAELAQREALQDSVKEKLRAVEAGLWAKKAQKLVPSPDKRKPEMVRIEIVVDAEGLNVEELSKKLAKLLPDSKVRIVSIHGAGGKVQIDHGTGRIEYYRKDGDKKPVKPAPQATPAPQPRKPGERSTIPLPPGSPQDKRINDLEKKLEKVLQELQELRKQMKEPRSGRPSAGDIVVPNVRFRIEPPVAPPVAPKQP